MTIKMKKIIAFILIIGIGIAACLFILAPTPTIKPKEKLPNKDITIPLDQVTFKYLIQNGWCYPKPRKLWYNYYQDSGYMYVFQNKVNYDEYIFHILNRGDTVEKLYRCQDSSVYLRKAKY
jgi:hypothetical protein